jgi:hypothetical protein
VNRGPLRLTANARLRHADSVNLVTPSISGSYALGQLFLRGSVEGQSIDSLSRTNVSGEWEVGEIGRVGAAADRLVDHRKSSDGLASTGTRVWAGLRLGSVWIDGGAIRRDTAALVAPTLLGADSATIFAPPASGLTLRVSGRLWKSLFADINALRWNDSAAIFRPKYQTRSELFVRTNLPTRFPKGNFGFLLSVRHDYRSASLIPLDSAVMLRAQGERAISTLLEIRIYGAVVSWQLRNVVGTRNYEAPNYLMPRTANFYGVRWEFWN